MLLPATPAARLAPAVPCPPCTLDRANTRIWPLQRLVRRGWDALQATLADADRSLPALVTHEVERALSCGDPTGGFAWLACPGGHHHRLVPYCVESSLSLGTMTTVAQPATGDERLLVVALPPGAKWSKTAGWHGFCEVAGGVGPDFYPDDAAVGTATFTVYQAGTEGCAKVPGIEAVRNQLIAPPTCPL